MRSHKAAVTVLAKHLRKTGAHVEEEAAIHELYTEEEDGRICEKFMDLEVRWAGGRRHLIDMTIRSPYTAEAKKAAKQAGVAAEMGENDKIQHYGHEVRPLAIETFGRIGKQAEQLLADLGRDAHELGQQIPGTRRTTPFNPRNVRAEIEAEIVGCDAARCLEALGTKAVQAIGWAASIGRATTPGRPATRTARTRRATEQGATQDGSRTQHSQQYVRQSENTTPESEEQGPVEEHGNTNDSEHTQAAELGHETSNDAYTEAEHEDVEMHDDDPSQSGNTSGREEKPTGTSDGEHGGATPESNNAQMSQQRGKNESSGEDKNYSSGNHAASGGTNERGDGGLQRSCETEGNVDQLPDRHACSRGSECDGRQHDSETEPGVNDSDSAEHRTRASAG